MIKYLLLPLLLAGCVGRYQPVKTEYQVVKPDKSLFKCDVAVLPDPSTLTDIQVAALINELYANNKICKNNMDAIENYIDTAQKILQKK